MPKIGRHIGLKMAAIQAKNRPPYRLKIAPIQAINCTKIKFWQNYLIKLHQVFSSLVKLELISLYSNQLTTIHSDSFGNLSILENIDLNGNKIIAIDEKITNIPKLFLAITLLYYRLTYILYCSSRLVLQYDIQFYSLQYTKTIIIRNRLRSQQFMLRVLSKVNIYI